MRLLGLLCIFAICVTVVSCSKGESSGKFISEPSATESKLADVGGADGAVRLVSEGMTTNDVDRILGRPDDYRAGSQEKRDKGNFVWSWYEAPDVKRGTMKYIMVKFRDFRVVSVLTGE